MKTQLTLLVAGVLSAIALTGSPASAAGQQPLVITDLRGSVRIQVSLPCGDPVDETTSIAAGRMDIKPEILMRGREIASVMFDLTRLDTFLTPFEVRRKCGSIEATAVFREIGLRLAGAVRFPGKEVGAGQYRFIIPKEQFLVYASVVDNAPVPQPETTYQRPSADVFGLIDLPRETVQLHVVFSSQVRLREGCVGSGRCLIDQKETVTQTADVVAVGRSCTVQPSVDINPRLDTTPPTVSCTANSPPGSSFLVLASDDDCTPPTLTLGDYNLVNGEVIQLQQTGQPGIRLLATGRAGSTRHFQVGRGEGVVWATDAAGNTTPATCR
jgi:hypothetical protein